MSPPPATRYNLAGSGRARRFNHARINRHHCRGFNHFALGTWVFVLWLLALASGWTKLAERFQFTGIFQGELLRFQSARIRQANYNGCLQLGVREEGLYLVPFAVFRPFHQPLLLPWTEIRVERLEKFLFKGYRLSFPACPGVTVDLPARTFEKVMQNLKEQTGYRPGGAFGGARADEAAAQDDAAEAEAFAGDEPGETPPEREFGHLLGSYATAETPRLLEALQEGGIPFELDMEDRTDRAGMRGSYGWNSNVKVWVRPADQEAAERIQAAVFDIRT